MFLVKPLWAGFRFGVSVVGLVLDYRSSVLVLRDSASIRVEVPRLSGNA
jgi:hypothetical protein